MTTATEHLTTGWEPDVPVGDSLLRRYLFAWAAQCEAVVGAAGGVVDRTPAYALADLRRPAGLFGAATLLAPLPEDPDAVLDEVERRLEGGTGEVHLWSAWPTPDLSRRGWGLVGHPPLLVRPPARMAQPPIAPDVPLRLVLSPVDLAAWERVAVRGYPMPELLPHRRGALADPSLLADPRFRFALGIEDGRAVSIGTLFCAEGVAVFALGVTEPAHRGRGHWRAHAVDRLRAVPDRWAVGIFSDHSRPLAEAIGFVPISRFTLWSRRRR